VATIIIKRLRDAIADGDPIRAVIRETVLNQDGKTDTITSPSKEAQEALMRECYSRAGIDPLSTQYFEAHGTGTATGDPIEAAAIAAVFGGLGRKATCNDVLRIGSVKTNIGHTEATSGLASVIKVVLAMERGKIPPSINFEKPNPKLQLEEWGLKVQTKLEVWPTCPGGIFRASVNNFGYGGANAHVIIDHATSSPKTTGTIPDDGTTLITKQDSRDRSTLNTATKLLILSAKDEQVCRKMVENLTEHLVQFGQSSKKEDTSVYIQSLIYTLGQRRTLFPWIAAHPVPLTSGVGEIITALNSPKFRPTRTSRQPRIGMVFTGQGAQWHAMGRELIPVYSMFETSLAEAEGFLKRLGADWSLMEELHRDAKTTRLNGTAFSIPICVAVQIALVRLLRSWGVVPVAVTSHSSGEIAAAYTVGAISFRSAMAIAYFRSKLAAEMTLGSSVKGGMLAVGLGSEDSELYIERLTCGATAVVACINSPSSTTIAGDVPAVEELEALLKANDIFARRLKVDTAYHSHHMNPIAERYHEALCRSGIDEDDETDGDERRSTVFASAVTGFRMTSAKKIAHPEHWLVVYCSQFGSLTPSLKWFWVAMMERKLVSTLSSRLVRTRLLEVPFIRYWSFLNSLKSGYRTTEALCATRTPSRVCKHSQRTCCARATLWI
jgi:acyl transferase domain-containing protein